MTQDPPAETERMMEQPQANVTSSQDAAGDSLVVDLTHDGGAHETEEDAAQSLTRNERDSAMLPSIAEDASDVT
jgi:hypothetical protein